MNIFTVENVTKKINKRNVLIDISLTISEGGVYTLCGTNGSGKSMLLRLLCGLIHPTSGIVRYKNLVMHQDIYLPPSIGVIIENPGFWQDLSGADNLRLFSRIKNIICESDIRYWMEYFNLDFNDPRPVRKYSLGMRQKLGIAQAMMEQPEVLLLDEPMNALDKATVDVMQDLLVQEKKKGTTMILTSHRETDFKEITDMIIEMDEGRICSIHKRGSKGLDDNERV